MKNQLPQQFENYLKDNLRLSVVVKNSPYNAKLPILFLETYQFYVCSFLQHEFLLVLPKLEEEITPATIGKHTQKIRTFINLEVIFVTQSITSYNRKRLIEHKVSFVIPGNQMYLPTLGIDLREHFRKIRSNEKKISPATQVAILYLLYNPFVKEISALSLSKNLHYSTMTMSRCLDELEAIELGIVSIIGRNRIFKTHEKGNHLWQNALMYLQSPIKKVIHIETLPKKTIALSSGFTGLSKLTMLSDSKPQTFAVSLAQWKIMEANHQIKILPLTEIDAIKIEVWKYDPSLFGKEVVDRLSLYLCFKNTNDERTSIERDHLLEGIQW